jgi:endonuclease/exonuclease/phosphatase family metal-dependent hydrolase
VRIVVALGVLLSAGCGSIMPAATGTPRPLAACRAAGPLADQPVQWLLPEAQRARLDAWCAAVGPPVKVSATPVAAMIALAEAGPGGLSASFAAAPPFATRAAVDSLLVVAWNVHVGGGDLRRFVRELRSGALTGGGPVTDFVLLIQEAYRGGREVPAPPPGTVVPGGIVVRPPAASRQPIDELAQHLGLHLFYVPSMRNGGGIGEAAEDRGNAILSSLPLSSLAALELPVERQRRVAAAANVDGTTSHGRAWTLQLVSVHLENRVGADVDGVLGMTGVAARGRQIEWLLEHLPASEIAVLGGDLNTWVAEEDELAARIALQRFPDTPPQPDGPTHASLRLFRARLDYIYGRVPGGSITRYVRGADAYGSDHFPLLAWVRLP